MELSLHFENNIAIIRWHMTTSPMNVLNATSIPRLEELLQEVYQTTDCQGLIITSDKDEFIAGADVKMILANGQKDPATIYDLSMDLARVNRGIETWGKPVVAAMNGTTLGGGYELCLACHHRVALNNPKAVIGLPEVSLGLLPGGGGTQRLPRLIGMERALPLILGGTRLNPTDALSHGLVDELAQTREEMMQLAHAWIAANPSPKQPWDAGDFRGLSPQSAEGQEFLANLKKETLAKTRGNYPAPLAIIACVEEGLSQNFDAGIETEARYFVQVTTSKEAKNLIEVLFFGKMKLDKLAYRPTEQPATEVKKLGILGAGFMGSGIAYVAAQAGIEVVMKDVTVERAEKGKDYSRQLVEKGKSSGKITAEKGEKLLGLIQTTDNAADLTGCDLIVEAVFEDADLKATVTKEAAPYLAEGGVFASNTTSIPITKLADNFHTAENFIGIHFFSPVDKMPLVEIIRGKKTSDHTLAVAMDLVKKLRKTPIVVNDSRGFYTSRVFTSYTSEGVELLKDGVAPDLIEQAGRAAGMPVGPLAVADEVALDLMVKIAYQGILDGSYGEEDTAYSIFSLMSTKLGRHGKKNKMGFYEYPEGGKKQLWAGLTDHFPLATEQPTPEEVKTRLLYRQSIETVKCLAEGVLNSKLEGNIGSILGWGFPSYLGGTLNFIDYVGKDTFIAEAARLANTYGERFRLSDKDLAAIA